MACNEQLAAEVRRRLIGLRGFEEKRMFGGVGFLLNGNMACGIVRDLLVVRVGPDRYTEALDQPHAAPFDLTGRPMKGWVQIAPDGWKDDQELSDWVAMGAAFAGSLPAK